MLRETLEQLKNLPSEVMNAMVLTKLLEIEKKVDQKVSFLLVEDAIAGFREALQKKKRPQGYEYPFELMLRDFSGRNIAEINTEEMERFMALYWGNAKNNSLRVRHAQLNALFNYANKILRKKKAPQFENPMEEIDMVEYEYSDVVFLKPEQINKVINAVNLEHHWLAMAILASTGMRPGELLKLKVGDRKGQVLTLREPKSGNKNEWVVIPRFVERVLEGYISSNKLQPEDRIIPLSHSKLNEKVVQKYSKKAGSHFTPKYFRNWCASFWYRQMDFDMVHITLRHKTRQGRDGKLKKIYLAELSQEEAIEHIKVLEKALFKQ